tara:strand:+ start:126 stop:575 length:450 start_codon:yes stop_codon:yes gene_type:complete
MARIDYSISVTPIQTNNAFEGVVQEEIDAEIGRSLGGGKSNLTWAGNAIDAWADGVFTYIEATTSPTAVGASGDNGVWIKHTGKAFDSSKTNNIDETTPNTESVTIKANTTTLCTLGAEDCIFIPSPTNTINIVAGDDTGPAIEYAKLT